MDKVLTIIVPAYNMEMYLRYCLDSLCISRYEECLEVLVVNDGSKDATSSIAHEYADEYPEIFKVIDKENGNYGSCINAAVPVAVGKYIKVVDADDSVDTQNLEGFISFLRENDVDLALSDFILVDENRNEIGRISYNWGKCVMPMQEICITERFQNMEMHAVAYRRQLLLCSGYRQTEGISYTDQQWIFAPMIDVRTVGAFNKPVYQYLVGRVGQTIDPVVKMKKMPERIKNVLDMAILYDKLCHRVTVEMKSYLDARIRPNVQDIYITYFSNISKFDKQVIHQFDEDLHQFAPVLYNYIGTCSSYIKIWRSLASCSRVAEVAFCKVFAIVLWLKVSFSSHRGFPVNGESK